MTVTTDTDTTTIGIIIHDILDGLLIKRTLRGRQMLHDIIIIMCTTDISDLKTIDTMIAKKYNISDRSVRYAILRLIDSMVSAHIKKGYTHTEIIGYSKSYTSIISPKKFINIIYHMVLARL